MMQDPHFKKANHRRRIISPSLLSEYAYCMADGGIIYTITDVQEVGTGAASSCTVDSKHTHSHESAGISKYRPMQVGIWMRDKLAAHPCFEPVPQEDIKSDPAAQLLIQATEEGQKVARNSGQVSMDLLG